MKKNILMGVAALLLCGTVNATSWRVCSKPEAGANFTSVAEAVASNSVLTGDTLYIEPGHVESNAVTISKKLHLIGPGYYFIDNNINVANPNEAIFLSSITFEQDGSSLYGCHIKSGSTFTTSMTICGNIFDGTVYVNNNDIFKDNFINNSNLYTCSENNITIENNIIYGHITASGWHCEGWYNSTIRNNTIIGSRGSYSLVTNMHGCDIYNNIIINTSTNYETYTNSDQIIDTIWYRERAIDAPADNGNNVYNNILSCNPNAEFRNSVFNATVEDVLIWNDANTLEEKYKHKANGPAVGAGVNGTTCGAYGAVNGSRAYQPAGIPQYRPYIYDATIDETPSSNNTINASFKIKVQQ